MHATSENRASACTLYCCYRKPAACVGVSAFVHAAKRSLQGMPWCRHMEGCDVESTAMLPATGDLCSTARAPETDACLPMRSKLWSRRRTGRAFLAPFGPAVPVRREPMALPPACTALQPACRREPVRTRALRGRAAVHCARAGHLKRRKTQKLTSLKFGFRRASVARAGPGASSADLKGTSQRVHTV